MNHMPRIRLLSCRNKFSVLRRFARNASASSAAPQTDPPEQYAPREPAPSRVPPDEAQPDTALPEASYNHILRMYRRGKAAVQGQEKFDLHFQNPRGVFANNELDLGNVDVFGFDYDYTLAAYAPSLYRLIYDLARKQLVENLKYPAGIADIPFTPGFCVRGLHFDIGRGLLMKIDSYHNVQLGTVYRGWTPVPDDEVRELYGGTHISLDMMSNFYGKSAGPSMVHMIDLFSPPETMLLANTLEYFAQEKITFDSEYVYWDVNSAVQSIHATGLLHKAMMADVSSHLLHDSGIREFLTRLRANGKKVFLITNSGFHFINTGLNYLIGPDWRELFDLVVCEARKPKFFYETNRPFRRFNVVTDGHSWDRVTKLQKGQVYIEGNLAYFLKLTGWVGSKVLYFGDHVYSDLADASLKHGWRTGAIIPELEREIQTQSSPEYVRDLIWKSTLLFLIEELQKLPDSPKKVAILTEWRDERRALSQRLKALSNPHFGSLFRTHHNPTYLSRRLSRFADIYTSALSNLLPFSLNHTFYPARSALPHEWQVGRWIQGSENVPLPVKPDA